MLDRVEVKLDPKVPFTNYFQSVCGDLRWESSPTELYKEKVYLEGEFGATVILLRWCRFGASHKIVFLETAKTTLRQMAETIENIFDCTSGISGWRELMLPSTSPGFRWNGFEVTSACPTNTI